MLALPEAGSPKSQAQLVGVFDDVSVKITFRPGLPVVAFALKLAIGACGPPPPPSVRWAWK